MLNSISIRIFILTGLLSVSIYSFSQKLVVIDFDPVSIEHLTGNSNIGTLLPINDKISIVNFGYTKLALVNNYSGRIIKYFNEKKLLNILDSIILKKYKDGLSRHTEETRKFLPYCSTNEIQYGRSYQINQSNTFACQIDIPLRLLYDENILKHYIVFFNSNLEILSVIERDKHPGPSLTPNTGGFFLDKNNFYIQELRNTAKQKTSFVHFKLKNNTFKLTGELELFDTPRLANYFTGRHNGMFQIKQNYYLNDEKSLIKLNNITGVSQKTINFPIKEQELISGIRKISNNKIVGLSISLDRGEGAPLFSTLIETNLDFNNIKSLKKYDLLNFTLNTLETYDNKVYIFLFDRYKKKYLLDIIEID